MLSVRCSHLAIIVPLHGGSTCINLLLGLDWGSMLELIKLSQVGIHHRIHLKKFFPSFMKFQRKIEMTFLCVHMRKRS